MKLTLTANGRLHNFEDWIDNNVLPSPALAYLPHYLLAEYAILIFALNPVVQRWNSFSMACLLPSDSVYIAPTCGLEFYLETGNSMIRSQHESISIALTLAACYKLAFNPTTDKEVRDLALNNYFGLLDDIQSFPDKDMIIALAEADKRDLLVFNDITITQP
jgi:hypothetical protein